MALPTATPAVPGVSSPNHSSGASLKSFIPAFDYTPPGWAAPRGNDCPDAHNVAKGSEQHVQRKSASGAQRYE